ncbi:MAG: hypothetical protein KBC35_01420 [Candidatus Pacebacteria bacterium]|nr:hypothetical protein [Candidatus Paceibacterota bacterium]
MIFMGALGIGSIFGMATLGYFLGQLLSLLAKHSRLSHFSRLAAATFSVSLGVFIISSTTLSLMSTQI